MKAVAASFGGSVQALHHTNVVIIERGHDGAPTLARQFVYGPAGTKPWGISLPQCPECRVRGQGNGTKVNLSLKNGELHRVRFRCEMCKIRTEGSILRPDWVRLSSFNHLVFHYILPFPTPEWPPMNWHPVDVTEPSVMLVD